MAIQVNPPPQHKIPDKILNDKELRNFFVYQQEYLFKLWLRTGGGEDAIDTITNETTAESGTTARLRANFAELQDRVQCLEDRSTESTTLRRIATLNKRIDDLIDTLIEEIRALRNDERDKQVVLALCDQINELRLQNAILEEAFETGIVMRDVT